MSISTRISISWPPSIPSTEPTNTLVLSFPSSHFIDLRPLKNGPELDWGMAGYSISTPVPDGTKTKFVHTVDSRVPEDPLSVKDEGLFKKMDNGDELETGRMINPDIGELLSYEEVWRQLPGGGKGCVLLESIGEEDKCFVGRVGKWFQGIGTKDGVISAARKEFVDGEWVVRFNVGDESVVPLFKEESDWKVGNEVEVGARTWKVIDCEI